MLSREGGGGGGGEGEVAGAGGVEDAASWMEVAGWMGEVVSSTQPSKACSRSCVMKSELFSRR